jgi:hypothetical protein
MSLPEFEHPSEFNENRCLPLPSGAVGVRIAREPLLMEVFRCYVVA